MALQSQDGRVWGEAVWGRNNNSRERIEMTRKEYMQRLEVAVAIVSGMECEAKVDVENLPWRPLKIEDTEGCWNPPVIFQDGYIVRIKEKGSK
jgi:hypothetical protein